MSNKKISEHVIGCGGGYKTLIEWVSSHKYRNCTLFDSRKQLEYAKRIARIEDPESRKLALELLEEAEYNYKCCQEMHKEFDTIETVIKKFDELND